MKSNICVLSGDRSDIKKALKEVEKFAQYNELSHKETLHLRLLVEEMLGMQINVIGFISGEFYLENQENTYNVYLHTEIDIDKQQAVQDDLVGMSTSGKNAAYTGFMGRIRKLMDNIANNSMAEYYQINSNMVDSMVFTQAVIDYDRIWELSKYREKVRMQMEQWDELEKSIVASIADELVVGTRSNYVDLIAVKKFK